MNRKLTNFLTSNPQKKLQMKEDDRNLATRTSAPGKDSPNGQYPLANRHTASRPRLFTST